MGIGCVAHDEEGRFLRVSSARIQGNLLPTEAEAVELRETLSW